MTDPLPRTNPGPWVVVAIGFLALALSYSVRAGASLMMPIWDEQLGWSRSYVSGCIAVALIIMAVLAPVAGRLVDRHGPRGTLVAGLVALAIGCLVIALAESAFVFAFAFAGIAAVGFGIVATHIMPAAIEQSFDRNTGFLSGLATSGSSGGQLLIVPLLAVLLESTDWRTSFAALGFASLLCAFWAWRSLPSSKSSHADAARHATRQSGLTADVVMILRNPAFQILFWSYAICGYTTTGVIETHFLPYAAFCGFGPVPSATAYGVLSALNLVGMIFVGWLTDRMNRPLLLGSIYLIRALTFVVLINVGADIEVLFAFAAFYGFVDYSTVPVTASLIASHIGVRVMGLAFGIISAGHQIGAAIGAYLGGYLFEAYARYAEVWWSSVALAALAGMMVFLLRDKAPRPAV